MNPIDILHFIQGYGALVIGAGLLIVASFVLPAGLRKYVWTAGLTILIYRFFQIRSANKLFQKADKERDKLRGELDNLLQTRKKLLAENEQLRKQLAKVHGDAKDLINKSNQLDAKSSDFAKRKADLDSSIEKKLAETAPLNDELSQKDKVLRIFDEADHALAASSKN